MIRVSDDLKAYLSSRLRSLSDHNDVGVMVANDTRATLNLTLKDILRCFPFEKEFAGWIKQIKELEAIHMKRIDAAVKEGKVVSRDLVKRGIIDPIETAHVRLMTDGASKIAAQTRNMYLAGKSEIDVRKFIVSEIGSHIRAAKARIRKNIKSL